MKGAVKNFFQGLVIGAANIIPGVSGGTMALVLGIYERLLAAIGNVTPATAKACVKLLTFRKNAAAEFAAEMNKIDLPFLAAVAAGAIAAIVALASIMTWLLENAHDPTYGFFFGLVLVSVYAPFKLINQKTSASAIVPFVIAAAAVAVFSYATADSMAEKARYKQAAAEQTMRIDESAAADISAPVGGEYTNADEQPAQKSSATLTASKAAFFFLAGAIAISAMILPGISGSFVMLLIGVYFDLLRAVTERNFTLLLLFCAGCGIGLLLFTRLLNFLLKKFHDSTMGLLSGLVIGSLWAIWPFKHTETVGSETVYTSNAMPTNFSANELWTFAAFVAGCLIVSAFILIEKRTEAKKAN